MAFHLKISLVKNQHRVQTCDVPPAPRLDFLIILSAKSQNPNTTKFKIISNEKIQKTKF
jgi:hypothetical protein